MPAPHQGARRNGAGTKELDYVHPGEVACLLGFGGWVEGLGGREEVGKVS